MLNLPFAGEQLAFIGYIFIPTLLFSSLYFLLLQNANTRPNKLNHFKLLGSIAVLILLSFIPPQQKVLEPSIAYHPYIFSAFTSQNIFNKKNTSSIALKEEIEKESINTTIENKKNIVVVVLESFGANTIQENITPFLYQLKQNSIYFEHAYAVIPHTSKALVTIHCGSKPYLSPYLLESNLGIATDCLAHQVQANNYQSVFFQSVTKHFENRKALVRNLGFNEFYPLETMDKSNFEAVNYFGYEDDIMLPKSKHWLLEREIDKPFVASYLTGTSHHNYDTPSNYPLRKFHEKNNLNRYLNAASYVDRFSEKLIQQYKDLGIYDDTIFVFVGDHGEGFGEHRPLMHNNNIYNSGLKIPLIIHDGTQILTPQIIYNLTSQSEIRGLIINILNSEKIKIKENTNSIMSSCWYSDYCYSLIQQDEDKLHKLILDFANNKTELYDLVADPAEKNNLISANAVLAERLEKELKANIQQHQLFYEQFYRSKHNNFLNYKIDSFSKFQSVTH
jgi:lipoteichoic acid synthase